MTDRRSTGSQGEGSQGEGSQGEGHKVTLRLSGHLLIFLGLIVCSGDLRAKQPSASYILVDKSERQLTLYRQGHVLGNFDISLGSNPLGHKHYEGDRRTPEGIYRIDARNPDSDYHLSLRISYPNERDTAWAHKHSLAPGGQIMIHGMPNDFRLPGSDKFSFDWTDGCIAVADHEMEEIWRLVEVGTLIEIRP